MNWVTFLIGIVLFFIWNWVDDDSDKSRGLNIATQIFDTIKEAAIWAHGSDKSKSAISFCCKGKRNIALGYHWEYVEV